MNVNGLVEGRVFVGGLGPDPTGELTALAQTSWVDFGERKLRKGKGRVDGKRRERKGRGKGKEKGSEKKKDGRKRKEAKGREGGGREMKEEKRKKGGLGRPRTGTNGVS